MGHTVYPKGCKEVWSIRQPSKQPAFKRSADTLKARSVGMSGKQMETYTIPQYLISAVADSVCTFETHASLDSLFMYANAAGDPPEGSKAVKALEWLRRISKECGAEALPIVGRIIEKYMEEKEDTSGRFWTDPRQANERKAKFDRIKDGLERAGLTYSSGGILTKGEGLATKTLSELIKSRNIGAIDF